MATMMNKSLMIMVVVSVCLVLYGHVTMADLQRIKHPTKKDGSLSLLVVGDWGRKGLYNQTLVAKQMGIVGEKLEVDFIVSTGDNFYDDGLTGVNDPAFAQSFSSIYTAPSLQKIWYNVLGNHDYRGDVLAQLSSDLREKDSKWFCDRSYIVNAGEIADFIFVDTSPFQDSYFEHSEHAYNWTGILPRDKYLSNLLKDVNQALKESSAKWKFVIGHHTLMSAGSHGNTVELVEKLLPILKENDVDLYINGHDHCLQHISSSDNSPLQFLTSGGGSMAWRGGVHPWNPEELKLYYDGQGFMSIQVTSTQLDVVFYDVFGKELHKWSRTKQDSPDSL